jgi:cobyric acid synthase
MFATEECMVYPTMRLKYKLYLNPPAGGPLGIKLKHRIGLAYLPGALPCFEDFGSIPTDIVRGDGRVQGEKASEILDLIIIPGGSLVESQSLTDEVVREILKMADEGKFVLGICSGLQVLSKTTDIGRLSSTPILREGVGLLDAEFQPLICTDRVSATVVGKSFMTSNIGSQVTGFHCHTYGKLVLHDNVRPILVSHIQRANYKSAPQDIVSGVTNKNGNVVGVLMHALLERNPSIIDSVAKSLNLSAEDLQSLREANTKLRLQIESEVGIFTSVTASNTTGQSAKRPEILLITATGSGSGKTFIVTGVAGALKKQGFHVGVVKVGGDIRDLVPALYLIKEPIRDFSSIKIGDSGWSPLTQVVDEAAQKHDFILIEGAMNAFTGMFNDNVKRPTTTAEVAVALDAPTILVVGCDKEGIEGAVINGLNYAKLMLNLGIKVKGVIFNKARISYLTDDIRRLIKRAFKTLNIELLGIVPRIELEGRGMIPEVEIRYEEFGAKAIDTIEQNVNLDLLAGLAEPPKKIAVDYEAFTEKFKNSLTTNSSKSELTGGQPES